jgi:hypothetical protein
MFGASHMSNGSICNTGYCAWNRPMYKFLARHARPFQNSCVAGGPLPRQVIAFQDIRIYSSTIV